MEPIGLVLGLGRRPGGLGVGFGLGGWAMHRAIGTLSLCLKRTWHMCPSLQTILSHVAGWWHFALIPDLVRLSLHTLSSIKIAPVV